MIFRKSPSIWNYCITLSVFEYKQLNTVKKNMHLINGVTSDDPFL